MRDTKLADDNIQARGHIGQTKGVINAPILMGLGVNRCYNSCDRPSRCRLLDKKAQASPTPKPMNLNAVFK